MTREIPASFRVGRCNHCRMRPAYAWDGRSGLRIDEVRCPSCGSRLHATSRIAHRILILTDAEIDAMRGEAIVACEQAAAEAREAASEWAAEAELHPFGSVDRYRCELNEERYSEIAAANQKAVDRMRKAAA